MFCSDQLNPPPKADVETAVAKKTVVAVILAAVSA
jgi:hypothetical protein